MHALKRIQHESKEHPKKRCVSIVMAVIRTCRSWRSGKGVGAVPYPLRTLLPPPSLPGAYHDLRPKRRKNGIGYFCRGGAAAHLAGVLAHTLLPVSVPSTPLASGTRPLFSTVQMPGGILLPHGHRQAGEKRRPSGCPHPSLDGCKHGTAVGGLCATYGDDVAIKQANWPYRDIRPFTTHDSQIDALLPDPT
jgi:hypothetical protein